MRRLPIIFAAVLLFIACTKLDYIGEEYPPTDHVDMYFSEADIEVEYKIMGRILATAGDFISSEKMQKDIIEKAREKGADGVLILGLDRYTVTGPTTWSETTKSGEDDEGTTVTTTTGSTSTESEDKKQVEALFLKYK
ncbi:MAG: hypothetical protein JSW34_12890 [Candidatus Zixiibacteriota bacterium]|nr:MAG: hypothetical protein JSW34_12890 [candidate division Zixibacteria bacterium]